MDFTAELNEINKQAQWAPDETKEQLNILQKAVNLIDANNIKTDLAIEIKLDYIKCATFCNFAKLALPHFSWVLNLTDTKDGSFSSWRILWQYKWMVADLYCHSTFPKAKLLELLEDMKKRFLKFSNDQYVIYDYSYKVYDALGMEKEKAENKEKLLSSEGGGMLSDCQACVTNNILKILFYDSAFKEFLEVGDSIIRGKETCGSVPKYTNIRIALSYIFVENDYKKAEKFAKKADKTITTSENFLAICSHSIAYNLIIKNYAQAIKLANRQMSIYFSPVNDWGKMDFSRSIILLTQALQKEDIKWKALPRLPELNNSDKNISTLDFMHSFFKADYERIIFEFDSRNGNNFFSEREKTFTQNIEKFISK